MLSAAYFIFFVGLCRRPQCWHQWSWNGIPSLYMWLMGAMKEEGYQHCWCKISFTGHVLLVKQQNRVIGLRKMTKPFKDIKLSNQTKDIKMTETILHIIN